MAKGKKTGGKDFKPGNKLGKGQPPLPAELREVKKFTRYQIESKLCAVLMMTNDELTELRSRDDTPQIDLIIAEIVKRAQEEGDERRLNFILDRMIGKVTQPISFEGELKKASNEAIAEAGVQALKIIQLHAGGQNGKALPGG